MVFKNTALYNIIPIEPLGIFIKPFSLLIRLHANMQAGHIVLMSPIGLMFIFKSWLGSPLSFGLAFAISIIELLVALLRPTYLRCYRSLFWLCEDCASLNKHLIVKKGMFNLNS